MRRFFRWVFRLVILPGLAAAAVLSYITYSHADLSKLPPLESGDLIFQTAITNQSPAIILATHSLYTHVGVIHKNADGKYTVIQAAQKVVETPLEHMIHGSWGERLTILRYPGLNDQQRQKIVADAQSLIGRPYNYIFYMRSPAVYCSEVPYFAYQMEHIPLGKLEKIGDLHVNNPAVHKLFDARWKMHPLCQSPGMNAEACWSAVMEEPIITPVGIAHDRKLKQIYTNYPF